MHNASIYLRAAYADEYDRNRFGGRFGRFLEEQESRTFLSMIDSSAGAILDVGAGTGKLSLPLLTASWSVISLDASPEMLRIARRKATANGIALRAIICDASQLCFRDGVFSCVVSSRVLMHLSDWEKALAELCRVARSTIVLDFPPRMSFAGLQWLFRIVGGCFLPAVESYRPRAFRVRAIHLELQKYGFRIAKIKRSYFLPIAFHRWLDRPELSRKIEGICEFLRLTKTFGAPVVVKAIKEKTSQSHECSCNRCYRIYR